MKKKVVFVGLLIVAAQFNALIATAWNVVGLSMNFVASTGSISTYSTATDINQNMVTSGCSSSGNLLVNGLSWTNRGSWDVVVTKNDSAGNGVWALAFGGTGNDCATSVATDSIGNVVITGRFDSSSMTVGSTTLHSYGGSDIFMVKANSSGSLIWAESFGGTANDQANAIVVNSSGNIFAAGGTASTSITFDRSYSQIDNRMSPWIAGFDPTGVPLWSKKGRGSSGRDSYLILHNSGSYGDYYSGLAIDSSSNIDAILNTDAYQLEISDGDFSSWVPNTAAPLNSGFIAKFSSTGLILNRTRFLDSSDSTNYSYLNSIAVDQNGNCYVVGGTSSGTWVQPSYTWVPNRGGSDALIGELSCGGSFAHLLFATFGGNGNDTLFGVSVSSSGSVVVTGQFDSPNITLSSTTIIRQGSSQTDMMIAGFTSAGQPKWLTSIGGYGSDLGTSVAPLSSGKSLLSGFTNSSSMTSGNSTMSNSSFLGAFLVLIDDAGVIVPSIDTTSSSITTSPQVTAPNQSSEFPSSDKNYDYDVRVNRTINAQTFGKSSGVSIPKGSSYTVLVDASSRKKCAIVGRTSIRGLAKGNCHVTFVVRIGKKKPVASRLVLVVG
jgi:hypothetical protein